MSLGEAHTHGFGTTLREGLIGGGGADTVGVTFDREFPVGVAGEGASKLGERAIRDRIDGRGAEGEVDAGQLQPAALVELFLEQLGIEQSATAVGERRTGK